MKKQFFIPFIIIFAFFSYFALVKQAHANLCVDSSVGVITSISPSSFSYGDTITINGSGFNQAGWPETIRFGDNSWNLVYENYENNVVSRSNNQIVLKVNSFFNMGSAGSLVQLIYGNTSRVCAVNVQWNYLPMCTFVYSDWNSCSANGQQTRTIISSSPNGCSGGNPILTQSCTP